VLGQTNETSDSDTDEIEAKDNAEEELQKEEEEEEMSSSSSSSSTAHSVPFPVFVSFFLSSFHYVVSLLFLVLPFICSSGCFAGSSWNDPVEHTIPMLSIELTGMTQQPIQPKMIRFLTPQGRTIRCHRRNSSHNGKLRSACKLLETRILSAQLETWNFNFQLMEQHRIYYLGAIITSPIDGCPLCVRKASLTLAAVRDFVLQQSGVSLHS
jgi:hypothetical protein